MAQALEAKGLLDHAIENAAERTVAAESSLIQQGVVPWEVEERMREERAFLPCSGITPSTPMTSSAVRTEFSGVRACQDASSAGAWPFNG